MTGWGLWKWEKDADIAIFDGMPFENLTTCVATMINVTFEYNKL